MGHYLGVVAGLVLWDGNVQDSDAPGPLILLHLIQLVLEGADFTVLVLEVDFEGGVLCLGVS